MGMTYSCTISWEPITITEANLKELEDYISSAYTRNVSISILEQLYSSS